MASASSLSSKDILLFFKDVEADRFLPGDRYLKRIVRPAWELLHSNQKKTGFRVSFEMLEAALRKAGYRVHVNRYDLARRNPTHPVGIVGFPIILDGWTLPNPALLGPSLYDHPGLKPDLFNDSRFKLLVTLADWQHKMHQRGYGDRCVQWFAGIDLDRWPDLSGHPKTIDFLVYDKIRWDHDALSESLLNPILAELARRGLRTETLRYKFHDHAKLKDAMARAKALLFICEHETQGLAYQEAMASGLPVLAWDPGRLVDPIWQRFDKAPPETSSVPFFSPSCGETFATLEAFPEALTRFLARQSSYDPRGYVKAHLSQEESARRYADAYVSLAGDAGRVAQREAVNAAAEA
ncbi:MAG TPA: hypothetical protein VG942_05090 [Hyphomonadaceae bacterium]|nr:hypothetical protein [Hyphomonadaceae bacterium]